MYQRLLLELKGYLYPILSAKLKSKTVAEDVLQDCLLSVHKFRHTFDPTHQFKPWVHAIMQSRISDYWRKNAKHSENEARWEESYENLFEAEYELTQQDLERWQGILNQLPEQQKHIVTLIKVEGLSIKEVADQLQMTESAVKVAAHRGYKKIKEMLYEKS